MPSLPARKLNDIAAVIKAAREDAGISQAELAERLAFPRDYMVDLEGARPTVYTTRLFRALHELGITLTLEYGDDHGES
jgi:HTH-type transcriptional regulator/antitoxin HipB